MALNGAMKDTSGLAGNSKQEKIALPLVRMHADKQAIVLVLTIVIESVVTFTGIGMTLQLKRTS